MKSFEDYYQYYKSEKDVFFEAWEDFECKIFHSEIEWWNFEKRKLQLADKKNDPGFLGYVAAGSFENLARTCSPTLFNMILGEAHQHAYLRDALNSIYMGDTDPNYIEWQKYIHSL